jgi:capsular polysaccharide export protein
LRALDQKGLPAPDLLHLTHSALIAYPRYFDPITRQPCPPEVALLRLSNAKHGRATMPKGPMLRLLSKAQGYFASYAHWWR